MDFAPIVTGTCGDCYDSFGLVKILAHGKKQLYINREVLFMSLNFTKPPLVILVE